LRAPEDEPVPFDRMEPTATRTPARPGLSRQRVNASLRHLGNWLQLLKFCVVGSIGYGVNLAVYWLCVDPLGVHYIPAAVISFLVGVTNNYTLNRAWTFRDDRGRVVMQGLRFLVVSLLALGANLLVLYVLVELGLGKIPAQAIAIVTVTPVNFIGNKLWSFRR